MSDTPQKAGWYTRSWILIPVVLLAVVLSAVIAHFVMPPGGDRAPSADYARDVAEHHVGKQLKASGSVEFSRRDETQVRREADGPYEVRGWVDAKNGFGPRVSRPYFVKLQHRGGFQWTVEKVVVDAP